MRRVVSIGDETLVVIPPVDWSGVECWSGELFQHRGSTAGMLVVSPVSRTGDPDIRDNVPGCFQRFRRTIAVFHIDDAVGCAMSEFCRVFTEMVVPNC